MEYHSGICKTYIASRVGVMGMCFKPHATIVGRNQRGYTNSLSTSHELFYIYLIYDITNSQCSS